MGYITVGNENSTADRALLRGPGHGPAGRPDPRLPARRPQLGAPDARAARRRLPRHHLRPPRLRPVVSKVGAGYDYDTFAADLNTAAGDPRPARRRPRRVLDGHRRARPLRRRSYGHERVAKLAFLASLEPFLVAAATTTPRACRRRSSTASSAAAQGRPVRLVHASSTANFYNLDENLGEPDQPGGRDARAGTSRLERPVAAYAVVPTWIEDFRADVEAVRASRQADPDPARHRRQHPADRRHRRAASDQRLPDAEYVEIEGAPHGLLWTHADEVNEALANFVAASALSAAA